MLQRILGAVLVIAGLGLIAFGVASATVLRESDSVVATARPVGDGTLVVTDPGVLDLVDPDVTVTATVPEGQEVTVVIGRDVDVLGWLGDDPYSRVTGLDDWENLATTEVEPTADEDTEADAAEESEESEEVDLPDPAGSDMWVTELTDSEQVSLRWNDKPGPWMLLAAGTGAAPVEEPAEGEEAPAEGEDAPAEATDADAVAPTLELTWDREVATPLLWPAVGVGGVLLVIGLLLLVAGRRKKRRRTRRSADTPTSPAAVAADVSPAGDSASDPSSAESGPATSAPGSAASPFGPTSGAPRASAFGAAAGSTWPPADPEPAADPEVTGQEPTDQEPTAEGEHRTGTAPVPVAGRFSRRSLRGRGRSAARPGTSDAAEPDDSPTPTPVPAPATPPAENPTTTTGSVPAADGDQPLTRRELRRREEERRAGEQSGVGRALRAFTGQTPAVRPAPDVPPTPAPEPPSSSARRAAAWRETWGFDPTAAGTDGAGTQDDIDDGGAR